MGWQDQLSRLDTELAHGRITAEQHRKQREELLAQASSAAPPSPHPPKLGSVSHPTDSTSDTSPDVTSDTHSDPTADSTADSTVTPVRWRSTRPRDAAGTPDALSAQPAWPTTPPTDWPTMPSPDWPTEESVVEQPEGASQAGGKTRTNPALLQPPIADPYADPPTRPFVPPVVSLFGGYSTQKDSRAPRGVILGGIGMLAVAGLLVAGLSLTGEPDIAGNAQADAGAIASTTRPPQRQPQPNDPTSRLERTLPKFPGVPNKNNSTMAVRKGVGLSLYTRPEADVLTANGAKSVTYRGSAKDGIGYAILVAPIGNPAAAERTAAALRAQLTTSGFEPGPALPGQNTLKVQKKLNDKSNTYRTVYRSGDYVVRFGLAQLPAGRERALANEFERTVTSVVRALPVS
ncbi:MAG: hypothetical protein GEU98_23820 [Pseudonocardiaceae bacterium]|nr:hypothetical protein [Pseudonocardiaceae bacterium]